MKTKPSQKEKLAAVLQLIELVNQVPKQGLPDLYPNEGDPLTLPQAGPMTLEELDEWWSRKFSYLHPKVKEFIGPVSFLDEAVRRYRMLQQAAEALRRLAVKKGEVKKPDTELARFQVSLEVTSEGKIVEIPNHLLQCLPGLEAAIIRRCRCGNVFLEKRKDQTYCAPSCANRNRARKSRGSQLYEQES